MHSQPLHCSCKWVPSSTCKTEYKAVTVGSSMRFISWYTSTYPTYGTFLSLYTSFSACAYKCTSDCWNDLPWLTHKISHCVYYGQSEHKLFIASIPRIVITYWQQWALLRIHIFYYGRCEPLVLLTWGDLKKPLKFGSESVLYAIVTIALQYSLAGGQGLRMVSSNTITASLSHDTSKSMLGQKHLDIWVLDGFHSVYHYNKSLFLKRICNIGHCWLQHCSQILCAPFQSAVGFGTIFLLPGA